MSSAPPILWMLVLAADPEDRRSLLQVLQSISDSDPGVLVRTGTNEEDVLFSGTGFDHLLQTCQKVADEHLSVWMTGEPRVRYFETITKSAEAEGKYIRPRGPSPKTNSAAANPESDWT